MAGKRFWWNVFGVFFGIATAVSFLFYEPTPKAHCTAFSGTKTRIHRTGGRSRTTYIFIQTDQEELKVRSNDRTINPALIDAPIGAKLTGLLDGWGHVVSLSVNGEVVATYEDFLRANRTERRWCASLGALFAIWCLVDAVRIWWSSRHRSGGML